MDIISKATIIIPLVVLMLGTATAFKNKVESQKVLSSRQEQTQVPTSTQTLTQNSSPNIKLDLKGPLVCAYKSSTVAINVVVKDKNVLLKKTEKNISSNYLLKGDCLYSWESNFSGTKICGLSQYISTFEALSKMGIMNLETALSSLSQFEGAKNIGSQEANIKETLKTCRKEEMKDSVFDLPVKVLFKDQKK